jgi:DNA-directed RNA polymerase subunit RPC12/RpoP
MTKYRCPRCMAINKPFGSTDEGLLYLCRSCGGDYEVATYVFEEQS